MEVYGKSGVDSDARAQDWRDLVAIAVAAGFHFCARWRPVPGLTGDLFWLILGGATITPPQHGGSHE